MLHLTKKQEKFIQQCRRVNPRNVELSMLDVNDPEIQPIEKEPGDQEPVNTLTHFIALYGNELDMTESTGGDKQCQGRFADPKTEVTWRAFKTALRQQVHAITRSQGHLKRKIYGERGDVTQAYILGLEVEDGTVQFSRRPFIHKEQGSATKEAMRLAEQHNKSFSVFKRVSRFGSRVEPVAVEETKQKEGGKPLRHPALVMAELEKFIANKDLKKVPIGIVLTSEGKYRVVTNDDVTYTDHDNYAVALISIIEWIKNTKKELKGEQNDS